MTVFIPFGQHCGPATILDQSGLRHQSLPFDWLFALPEYIKDSLDTDFQKWFDLDNLVYEKRESDGADTTKCLSYPIYFPEATEPTLNFFNHHDLTNLDVQEAFKRRIERFKNIIASDEHIVFLTISSQQSMRDNGLLDYFNRDARTDFVFLKWEKMTRNRVRKHLENGYLTIKYGSISHLSNPIVSRHIGDILRSID